MAKAKKSVGRPKVEGVQKYIISATTEHIEKMKKIADFEKKSIKTVFAEAMTDRIARYNKERLIVKPKPKI
ncbi:MAG TPA: hypothetical protein VIH86_00475 [Puia sp.]